MPTARATCLAAYSRGRSAAESDEEEPDIHDGEFTIDGTLVRALIREQFPDWSSLPLVREQSSGTVHAIYRLGNTMAVRLPRHRKFTAALERETELLPRLAPLLPIRIPEVVAAGRASSDYPSTWSILRWIDGENMTKRPVEDLVETATRLGEFVAVMRSIAISGPQSDNQRGRLLVATDAWTRQSIALVSDEFDARELTAAWESSLAVPPWNHEPKWIHGDLLPGNLIVADGELSAIIDFGECSVGNPTCDLIAGWWIFDGASRAAFKHAVQTDADSWNRARGWALSSAVGAVSYYAESNREFADMARATLHRVLDDR